MKTTSLKLSDNKQFLRVIQDRSMTRQRSPRGFWPQQQLARSRDGPWLLWRSNDQRDRSVTTYPRNRLPLVSQDVDSQHE